MKFYVGECKVVFLYDYKIKEKQSSATEKLKI